MLQSEAANRRRI